MMGFLEEMRYKTYLRHIQTVGRKEQYGSLVCNFINEFILPGILEYPRAT